MARQPCSLPLKAFVDQEYLEWLSESLPPPLLRSLQQLYGDNLSGIPWETPVNELFGKGHEPGRFNTYLTESLILLGKSRNAYHNMEHGQRVGCNCEDGLEEIQILFGRLPGELYQIALWAYALHDFRHCGSAFFALKNGKLPRGAHHDMPLEIFTAYRLDELLRHSHSHFYSPLARLVANYVVISSAFGAMHPEYGPRLRLHLVRPRAMLGSLMRVGDVLPSSDFVSQVAAEANLLYMEIPATPVAPTWRGYTGSRLGFLEYVSTMLDVFDQSVQMWLPPQRIPFSASNDLGWRAQLELASAELKRAQQGGFRMAALRATIRVHGDALS